MCCCKPNLAINLTNSYEIIKIVKKLIFKKLGSNYLPKIIMSLNLAKFLQIKRIKSALQHILAK